MATPQINNPPTAADWELIRLIAQHIVDYAVGPADDLQIPAVGGNRPSLQKLNDFIEQLRDGDFLQAIEALRDETVRSEIEAAFSADAAMGAARNYSNVAEGLAGVQVGQTFNVLAADRKSLETYRKQPDGTSGPVIFRQATTAAVDEARSLVVDRPAYALPKDSISNSGSAASFGDVTRILRAAIKRTGRLKTIYIQPSPTSSGALPITLVILNKTGKSGVLATGDTFTVDRRFDYTIQRGQFNTLTVDIGVSAGQYLGFYSTSDRAILLTNGVPPSGGYWLGLKLDSNGQYTLPVVDGENFYLSAGFVVEVSYPTPELYSLVSSLDSRLVAVEQSAKSTQAALQRVIAMRQDFINRGVSTEFGYSPNDFEGDTQSERVQAAMQFIRTTGVFARLVLGTDTIANSNTWVIDQAIVVPSNFELVLDGATLKRGDGVLDNLIRNDGIVPDAAHPNGKALELRPNYNIRILGINGARIEGADIVYMAPPPNDPNGAPVEWIGDDYGWRTIGILFANVSNFEIGGQLGDPITMAQSQCWNTSFERGIEQFWLHDLEFEASGKNSDGIDMRNGISKGIIERISGRTNDDVIALAAGLGIKHGQYADNYMLVGGTDSSPLGNDVRDILINDIDAYANTGNLVRINCTAKDGCKVSGIAGNKIHQRPGNTRGQLIIINQGSGYRTKAGDISNITFNDLAASAQFAMIDLTAVVTNLRLNKVRQNTPNGKLISYSVPYAETESTITVTNSQPAA